MQQQPRDLLCRRACFRPPRERRSFAHVGARCCSPCLSNSRLRYGLELLGVLARKHWAHIPPSNHPQVIKRSSPPCFVYGTLTLFAPTSADFCVWRCHPQLEARSRHSLCHRQAQSGRARCLARHRALHEPSTPPSPPGGRRGGRRRLASCLAKFFV
jgi:hypothetical protein